MCYNHKTLVIQVIAFKKVVAGLVVEREGTAVRVQSNM